MVQELNDLKLKSEKNDKEKNDAKKVFLGKIRKIRRGEKKIKQSVEELIEFKTALDGVCNDIGNAVKNKMEFIETSIKNKEERKGGKEAETKKSVIPIGFKKKSLYANKTEDIDIEKVLGNPFSSK